MSESYIAVLDHQHLENSIFLSSFAKSLAQHGDRKGIIIHGDSPYTDRIIQSGVMREEARVRAIKDLNKRLIGLFADQGVPTIGIHGYQKGLIENQNDGPLLNMDVFESLHSTPNLLVSNLIGKDVDPVHVPLPVFARALSSQLDADILLFSKNEKDDILVSESKQELNWDDLPPDFAENTVPDEFRNFNHPVKLTTATDFSNWPDLKKVTIIR